MIIISWDVGVIHLAYCILQYLHDEKTNKTSIKILDWDEINLIEDERIELLCCGHTKAKKGKITKECGKNATYYLHVPNDEKMYGFCKTHLSQYSNYWSEEKTKALFSQIMPCSTCKYIKSDGTECGKVSKYAHINGPNNFHYCTVHYKSVLNKKIKEFSPQPIKNLIVRKYPTDKLQINLIKKLDELSEHFAKLNIQEVIIENQPSQKNPKMKSISNTLFDYFLIRGYIDKIHHMDIQLVRFMCPSNKLKVNNDNTIEVFKANKDDKKKYKLTKTLSIQYTKQLLNCDEKQLEYLDLYKKKDDMCDAYLQGRYYLEYIRNKNNIKVTQPKKIRKSTKKSPKKVGGSKSMKKSMKKSNKKSMKKSNAKPSGRKIQKIICI
jgi:hypothetical protein